jgi:hypothetical protein
MGQNEVENDTKIHKINNIAKDDIRPDGSVFSGRPGHIASRGK